MTRRKIKDAADARACLEAAARSRAAWARAHGVNARPAASSLSKHDAQGGVADPKVVAQVGSGPRLGGQGPQDAVRQGRLQLHAEHRGHPAPEPVAVELDPALHLRVRNATLGVVLDRLEAAGRVIRRDGVLTVPRSGP